MFAGFNKGQLELYNLFPLHYIVFFFAQIINTGTEQIVWANDVRTIAAGQGLYECVTAALPGEGTMTSA